MSLFLECENKNKTLKTPLYELYDGYLVITIKNEKKVFNLNSITNIIIKKKINYFKYIYLLIVTFITCYLMIGYFENNILFYFALIPAILVLCILASSLVNCTYVLYIKTTSIGTIKFSLSKNYVDDALILISILKSDYLRK
jgi:hypothetical protein